MLTKLLIRDETTASLGKMENTFKVHISGETISQLVTQEAEEINNRKANNTESLLNGFKFHQPRLVDPVTQIETEIAFRPETSVTVRNSFRLPKDRKKRL